MNVQPLKAMRRHSGWRLTAALLCLVAYTFQSFVAQTHVHAPSAPVPATAGYHAGVQADTPSLAARSSEDSTKHGRRDDSSSCPLCQIVLHGGAAPLSTFAISLPLQTAISVAPAEQAPPGAIVAVSFSWQGRAPPLI